MVTIIADTTCSLPLSELAAMGIPVLPQIIIFGNQQFRDDNEIDTDTFLQKLQAASDLPKTAAPAPALYTPIYKSHLDQGNSIIVITPSAELSGTTRSATVAAEDFPGADIRIIDTKTVAGGLGSIVKQAYLWAKAGLDADTIEANIRALAARQKLYFIVDTLEYLYKGGRIGGAKMLMGSILQVKPILTLKNGRAEPFESQRTKRKALARIKDIVSEQCPHDESGLLSVSHCGAEEDAKSLAEELQTLTGIKNIPIYVVPPAIVVHGGPKILEVSFFSA